MYRAVVFLCRCVIRLFCRSDVEVRGGENFPATGPAVLVANHASYLDPPVLAMAVRRQLFFMAREGILRVPVLGWILRRSGVFAVKRGAADRTAIRHAISLLEQGHVLAIFPEGTRTTTGDLQVAEPGAALIAARAGVPLIPVALHGTREGLPRDAHWLRPAKLAVTFGPPIWPGEGETSHVRARELEGVSRKIMEEIDRLLEERRQPVASGTK